MKFRYLFVFFCLAACASTAPRKPSGAGAGSITVIATTDFHGELVGQQNPLPNGTLLQIGGAPYYGAYMKILRAHLSSPVLWIDAGDLFQGSMESNMFEGAPVVRMMNHLGLQAAALGNHEFDYGPVGDKAVALTASDDPRGALKARIHEANFPTLAANVTNADGSIPDWLKPSAILDVGGVRVGVVGGASPDTPSTTNAMNLVGLKFQPLLPALQQEAQRLRDSGQVDLVVITVHDGGACNDNSLTAQDDLSTCDGSDIIEFAKKLPPGLVNMIVAGHTHKGIAKRVNGIVILQPFSHGKYIGWASLPTDGSPGSVQGLQPVCPMVIDTPKGPTCDPFQLKGATAAPVPATFFGEPIGPDAETAAVVAPEINQVKTLKETALGFRALDNINREFVGESALGNLMADAARASHPEADIGMANGGGLRANINAGPVTYGDVFGVLPFDNQTCVMTVTGAQLLKLVNIGLFGNVGSYSWSSELALTTQDCTLASLTINGQPVDPDRTYKIATSDFLAGGGSGVSRAGLPKEAVQTFFDHSQIVREQAVKVLSQWHRDIRSVDFFNPASPRQRHLGKCAALTKSGGGN